MEHPPLAYHISFYESLGVNIYLRWWVPLSRSGGPIKMQSGPCASGSPGEPQVALFAFFLPDFAFLLLSPCSETLGRASRLRLHELSILALLVSSQRLMPLLCLEQTRGLPFLIPPRLAY